MVTDGKGIWFMEKDSTDVTTGWSRKVLRVPRTMKAQQTADTIVRMAQASFSRAVLL